METSLWRYVELENLSFEEAYARLEAAVAALQDGQMPLERALHYYEEGMKLAHHCDRLLQKAELRVQQLSVDREGAHIVEPLELS
jgi:exodeoxyribonuclease VII small subunit